MTPRLQPHEETELLQALSPALPELHEIWVFGSRATGKARKGSDLDLLLVAEKTLPASLRNQLYDNLEDSSLPFRVDLVESIRLGPAWQNLERIKLWPTP